MRHRVSSVQPGGALRGRRRRDAAKERCTLSEHTTQADQPSWAGAMAQIDAEIAELQEMLAKRRAETAAMDRDEEDPDSVA